VDPGLHPFGGGPEPALVACHLYRADLTTGAGGVAGPFGAC
jgi:hypothetical protein